MSRGIPFTFGQLAVPVQPDGAPMPGLGALGPYSGLRRSVIDPETGAASLSADALALAPDPNEVVSRGLILPLGRTRSGETVLASQGPIHAVGKAIEGLPDAPQQAVDAVRFFGDVASGRKGVFDPATGHVSDEAMGAAGTAAGLAMTGSMPFAVPSGALRTFGGRAAATADHAALDRAAGMQASGAAPDAIWRDTGWGLGRDGAARFEIPDDAARLRPHDGSPATTLGQALDHPALFAAYPGLRDVDVFHRPDLGPNAAANPSRNWVALNLSDPQALESLLHEGQHLVQRREGFAPGASPIDPALAAHPQVAEVAALRQRLAGRDDPAALALADRTDQAVRLDAYRTAAGEVEARNVEARRAMTPAERAASPPWATQDVPTDRQWIPAGRGEGVTGDGAQLKLGETAPADPLAALESGLAGFGLDARVPAGPARVDAGAPSWDLYHGSTAGPDFQRFDPNVGKAAGHSERGALFLTPDPDAASFYAGGTGAGAEAGPRVFRTTVDPGRTRVFDLPEMIEADPTLGDRARAALLGERGTPATAAETARADALRNAYREDLLASRAQDRDINRQLAEMGLPPSASTGATYGHGYLGAVIQMAKEQGLDTAVIRGLAEHGGADQVVALTPNRVRSAYAPDQLLYSGAGLGLGAAALGLAQPGDAQAAPVPSAPSPPRGASPVSYGSPFGFGPIAIPNADPDDVRRYLRRPVFDPAQGIPPSVVDALQSADPGSQQQPGAPAYPATDAPTPSPLRMFGSLLPQMPASTAQDAPAAPLPSLVGSEAPAMPPRVPAMPAGGSEGSPGAGSASAPRPLTFGRLPSPAPAPTPAPATTGSAADPAVPVPGATPTSETGAPTPERPLGERIGTAFDRFNANGGGDLMMSLGMGLMSTRGFGAGLAAGMKNYQDQQGKRAAADLARAEFGLKAQKAVQEATGLKGNQAFIKAAFPNLTPEQVAGGASNSTLVSAAIAKMQNPNAGRELKADSNGVNRWVDTGEPVFKDDQGKEDWQLVDVPLGGGQTQKQWVKKGEATGTSVGLPSPPDKPQGFDTESKLRSEFAKGIGTFGDVHDGYGRVIAATRQREANPNGVSPASDIGLVFGYMKMLDPGSVVREGEYATAANAAGIPERVRNAYNKAMNGEFLTGEQRQDFLGQAAELYGTARKTAEGVAGRYRNLATQYGVDPDRAAYLPEMPVPPTVGRDRMKPSAGQGTQPQTPAAPARIDLEAEARKRGLIR